MTDTTSPQGENGERTTESAETAARRERMRELGKRSAEVRAARKREAEEDLARQQRLEVELATTGDHTLIVQVPVPIAPILRELRRKATNGDVGASRELRAWLQEHPPADADDLLEGLDRVRRGQLTALLSRALAELEGESAAQQQIREGTIDGFDALPTTPMAAPLDAAATPADAEPLRARGSGRGVQALETVQTPLGDALGDGNEPLQRDGTDARLQQHMREDAVVLDRLADAPHQMDVEECIEEATRDA